MLAMRSPRRKFTPVIGLVSFATLLFCASVRPQLAWAANTQEFNAYHNAITHMDPSARAISLELFLRQYPAGDFSLDAEQLLLLAYSETRNIVAALPRAQALLHSRPSDPTALALLADDEREKIENGATSPSAAQQLQALATAGLRGLQQFTAPASVSPFEFQRLKTELTTRLEADAGIAELRLKQFPLAQSYLGAAVKQSPNDFQNLYQLALSYLTATPPDDSRGFMYLAQAAKLATGSAQQQITQYGRQLAASRYGSVTAWDRLIGGTGSPYATATAAPVNAYRSAQPPSASSSQQTAAVVPRPGATTKSFTALPTAAHSPDAPALPRVSTSANSAQSRASVSLGILVDGSVLGHRGSAVRQSLKHVASTLSGNDEAFLIDFGNGNTFEQDLTGDPDLLDRAFESSAGTGKVALYDAIVVGAEHLARIARNKKKVLLVLADREDSASHNSIFQAAGVVENVPNLSVYVVAEGNRKLQEVMAEFTRRIAGTSYHVESADGVSEEISSLMPTILGSSTSQQLASAAPDENAPTEPAATSEGGGIGSVRTSTTVATVSSPVPMQPSYKPLSTYNTLVISGISINGGQQTAALPGGEDILLEKLLVERLRKQTSFTTVVDGNAATKYPRPPIVTGRPILLSGEITQFETNPGYSSNQSARMHVRFVFRDASTGREIFTSEDDGEVKGAAVDLAGAETETLLRVADSLVKEINQNR